MMSTIIAAAAARRVAGMILDDDTAILQMVDSRIRPDDVRPLRIHGAKKIAARAKELTVLTHDGEVYGLDTVCLLAEHTTAKEHRITVLPRIVDISPQPRGWFGLDEDGVLFRWGGGKVNVVPNALKFVAICGGESFTIGLDAEGTVWSLLGEAIVWSRLGEGIVWSEVKGVSDVVAIRAGNNHATLLNKKGEVWGIGSNRGGERGGNTRALSFHPNLIALPEKATGIAAGLDQSYCQLESGKILGWGWNTFGEIGPEYGNQCRKPVEVRNPGKGFTQVVFSDRGGYFPGMAAMDALIRTHYGETLSL